jgi:hypothetical protein
MRRPTACRLIPASATLSREVHLRLLGRVALADKGSDDLVDDRHLEKACRGTPFGRSRQVLIEDEVTQGPGGEHARSAARSTKDPGADPVAVCSPKQAHCERLEL